MHHPDRCSPIAQRATAPRGVTLVEVLAVIAIVSVLVSLIAPQLAGARSRARQTTSASTVRHLAAVHAAYAGESHDQLFYPGVPDERGYVTKYRNNARGYSPFFAYSDSWPRHFEMSSGETRSPFSPYRGGWDFKLTCTSFTQPGYWDPRKRRADRTQWTGAGLQHVAFPERKSWLHDGMRFESVPDQSQVPGRWIAAFFDGSAAESPGGGEPYYNADGMLEGGMHGAGVSDGRHTINGLAGTDR